MIITTTPEIEGRPVEEYRAIGMAPLESDGWAS